MRTGKEINDLYARDVEAQTCGMCGNSTKNDVCMTWDTGLYVTEAGICSGWQPIPVATTDVPLLYGYPTLEQADAIFIMEDDDQKKLLLVWIKNMHESIAKRDDLIRRMAAWMVEMEDTKYDEKGDADDDDSGTKALISEANELMGVK